MSRAGRPRRLATILFLDIVDSTRIAAELGDRRWRDVLGSFRAVVRAELKRHRGREEDTAGDGFFVTFAQPAEAVRGAAAIVRGVQELGLDVRCGLHFGEVETIEGQRGGIAVHLASRVMSLAGAAEVLVTTTVRDLIVGADVELVDAGTHQLKGVPGDWQISTLRRFEGSALPEPLDPTRAAELRSGLAPARARDQRRRLAAAALVLAGVLGIALLARSVLLPTPPTILRIDPGTNAITAQVTDDYRSEHFTDGLWAVNGALWQASTQGFIGLVRRNMKTGAVEETIPVSGEPSAAGFGFGSIWIGGLSGPGSIVRWDAVTGRKVANLSVNGTIVSIDDGPDAMWVLGDKGALFRVDPIANAVVDAYDTHTVHPGVVVDLGSHVWVCDCEEHRLVEFDPAANDVARVLTFPQAGFLVGLTNAAGTTTLWLLDPQASTLTPIDAATGAAGQPIGIGANLHSAAVAFGSVWVAAGDKVLKVEGSGPNVIARIPMPRGMSAGGIAADPETNSLWIGNCGCPIE